MKRRQYIDDGFDAEAAAVSDSEDAASPATHFQDALPPLGHFSTTAPHLSGPPFERMGKTRKRAVRSAVQAAVCDIAFANVSC